MKEHLSKTDIINLIRNEKKFLKSEFGVLTIGLFGSYAKDEENADSDIDLVVEFEKGRKNIHTFLGLKRFLEKEFARKVDIGFEHSLKPVVRENIKGEILYV